MNPTEPNDISAELSNGAGDPSPSRYRTKRIKHWNAVGRKFSRSSRLNRYYHRRVTGTLRSLIPEGQRILELGCGRGDLLFALRPSYGVGVDFAAEMLLQAESQYTSKSNLRFILADVHDLELSETFDFIVLSDLVNDLWDVQAVFEKIRGLAHPDTRIVLNTFSKLWQIPLELAQQLGLKQPTLSQNWLAVNDVAQLLNLAGFEIIHHWEEMLWPIYTPVLADLCNRILVRFWPARHGALSNFIVARPLPAPTSDFEPVVSVIIPARNEAGNIPAIFVRTPEMGGGTELIFVEGHSTDGTKAAIDHAILQNPQRRAKVFTQAGNGKADAVRLGFANSTGHILMILDADLTVPPEDLPRFYRAIRTGKGELINGIRLVYPMEAQAMQTLNLVANRLFGIAFTWLLGQPVKDTLCGTKVLSKANYLRILANRDYFGDFDAFGDFDLLFGAAKLNLRIIGLPIRYRQRTYGSTNIQRFRHGLLLLRMVWFAARRIKFI